jgi:putative transposase
MYVQGVSTRKVKGITEELCGHEFSSATISRSVGQLAAELEKFARRRREEPYPYLVLDARYEQVREDGAVRRQAVLIAMGINGEGRRNVLAVERASRESASRGTELLTGWRSRSLHGVECVISDDHAGLRRALQEVLPEAVWQRCYVHFLRNALDDLPRKADDDCLQEWRRIYDRREAPAARQDLAAWLTNWESRDPKRWAWVEENIEATFSFYRWPQQQHKNMKSTNMLERLMEESQCRTLVVRIFPNAAACLRLVRALAVEMHENWMEAMPYLNMEPLTEQKKEALRKRGDAA